MLNHVLSSTLGLLFLFAIENVNAGVSIDGARGTVYYDLELQCTGDGSDAGGASGLNGALTACGYSAEGLGTSRFVAIDGSIFDKSMCGQEVIIAQNGSPFSFSEGPMFVGDLCGGCEGGKILDLSGKIAVEMMGGVCKNPPSFSYQITENIVGATLEGSLPAGGGSSSPVSSASAAPPASAPASKPEISQSQPAVSTPAASQPLSTSTQSVPPVSQPVTPATSQVAPATSQPVNPATSPFDLATAAATTSAVQSLPATTVAAAPTNTGGNRWGGGWGRPPALFAENETATNGTSCKRRKRRRRVRKAH
ncbi:hypothetical protein L486_00468 [Kwoniella mangroviensis CBS 10435]|uniref:Uncharacterized protein n=1 Tax=Kwoniella mangroviensis CBS 10435 TaxID=1331196 RepID=A0A1B9IZ71_9TREE|nr:hypothetical protein L486_00468 [Kwoniella mangroviensis CBS 10435]